MSALNVVCIPFHDIKLAQVEGFRTRDSHLYQFFAEHVDVEKVIVFNRPTMLLEMILGKKKLLTAGERIYSQNNLFITRVTDRLYAIDILDLSLIKPVTRGKSFIPELYSKHLGLYLKALSILNVKEYVTYESSPLSVPLSENLSPVHRIFDGVDNLCKHSTYAKLKSTLMNLYSRVLDSYPTVFFNSRDSIKYFSAQNKRHVEFLPNGVDFDRFRQSYPVPPLLGELSRPCVVYAGKMQEMLDTDLVASCASAMPNVTFLMLGKVLEPAIKTKLAHLENVKFGGDILYTQLPAYICNADVCFIPYRVDRQHGGDPIKFYEYMAANKKIISTEIGEIAQYHNDKDIVVCDRVAFVEKLKNLLSCDVEIANILPETMRWSYKADYMLRKAKAV